MLEPMTDTVMFMAPKTASLEEIQRDWNELTLRLAQLEAAQEILVEENKTLRKLLERAIEYRQKSHSELVLLLASLVSKLPINDVGVVVSRLVEHNTNVGQTLAGLIKGKVETVAFQPAILKTLEQTKRDLMNSLGPLVEELVQLDAPLETEMLRSLATQPELSTSPRVVRASRCFVKGQLPKERIVREFGEEALLFFNDMTTDAKLNPHPKPDEIVLGFKNEFEALFQQNTARAPEKQQALMKLFQQVQSSKAATDQARSQRSAFHRLSFLLELLHYYEHQNTEAPDVIFAQRLPGLVEQLVVTGPQDSLDEKLIVLAEGLLAFVISPEHRQMIVNNVGKSSEAGKTLKFVLRLRADKTLGGDLDQFISEFLRHLVPSQKAPPAETIVPILRLVPPGMQLLVVKALLHYDKLRKEAAEALAKTVADQLGLKLPEPTKIGEGELAQLEKQRAWAAIKGLISGRADASMIAGSIRDRLNARYDSDEIRQSWLALTEADALALIKIFCQIPYLPSGKTDPIARTVLETYVTRLMHEKYAATYKKVLNSLRSMFAIKPDNATLLNFLALVRWVSPEAANKLSADIGMPVMREP